MIIAEYNGTQTPLRMRWQVARLVVAQLLGTFRALGKSFPLFTVNALQGAEYPNYQEY